MDENISMEEIINALGSMQLQLMMVNRENQKLKKLLQGGENGTTIQTGEDK